MARQTELPPSDASVIPSGSRARVARRRVDGVTGAATIQGDAPMRTYEVHLGSWRRGVDDWDAFADQLEHARARRSGSRTSS